MSFDNHPDPDGGLLLLTRHGESEGNARNIFTGLLDLPLTDRGRQEALNTACLLQRSAINPDIVFSSALRRALGTAEIIIAALALDVPLIDTPALNERDYGVLTGHRKDLPVPGIDPDQVWRWRRSFNGRPTNGESLEDTESRVGAYYDRAIAPQLTGGRAVLVVAHGNSLRALLTKLRHLTPLQIEDLEIGTGEIIAFATSRGAITSRLAHIDPTERSRIFTL
ncbi:MAG TPA: 2,3-bisphosphoglycerate-dependent phosphoglycerate mutase [Xanthobacteraceae bacterium]|nr:2,3-bisphosphoglycerate-dependent phosphoglycerate mutase [Xanthobacteraceae bacterium]